ncbi:MAG TPA: NADH-quinone oxidoreductase subunit C [Candidatus Omnitrophota bacterium]|nr:NADH-quinone oxidoreductase subunit C [Candidatus Omnitrophota bacterium]
MTSFIEEIRKELSERLPNIKLRLVRASILIENPKDLTQVVFYLKENPRFLLDYLSSITAVDYLDYLESVYHLYSMEKKQGPVVLRVRVSKTDTTIPSLIPIYHGAELQEREAYDTFGIIYEGHPNLKRLFMWDGFEGYPLRKDYEQEDSEILETADIEWLESKGIGITNEVKEKAKQMKMENKRAAAQKPEKPRN